MPLPTLGSFTKRALSAAALTVRLQENGEKASGEKGKTWMAVLAPPSRMETRGLQRDALKTGVTATVVGYPSRTNPDELRAERITIDGKTTELR